MSRRSDDSDRQSAEQGTFGPGDSLGDPLGPNILGFLARHFRGYTAITLVVGLLTAAGVMFVSAAAPVERIVSLDVLLTFPGAETGKYPNGAPFNPNDVVANSVIEPVWRAQGLEPLLSLADLCRNVQVVEGGSQADQIRATYSQRLSNSKLTVAERSAIEREFQAALSAVIAGSIRLTATSGGTGLSPEQLERALLGIVAEWARVQDSMGANAKDYPVPSAKEIRAAAEDLRKGSGDVASGVLVAQQLKESVDALEAAGVAVAKLPGTSGVKDSSGATVVDLNREIGLIRRSLLLPAYAAALVALRQSDEISFLAIRSARTGSLDLDVRLAKEQARVLRASLSGTAADAHIGSPPADIPSGSQPAGVQATIDGSFLDRIVEQLVRGRDLENQRKLAERATQAELALAQLEAQQQFEAWLDRAAERPDGGPSSRGAGTAALVSLSERVALLAERMKEILDVLSGRTFNPGSAMYRIGGPAFTQSVRGLDTRSVMYAGIGSWLAASGLATVAFLLADRRRNSRREMLGPVQVAAEQHVAGAVGGLRDLREPAGRRLPQAQSGREPVA